MWSLLFIGHLDLSRIWQGMRCVEIGVHAQNLDIILGSVNTTRRANVISYERKFHFVSLELLQLNSGFELEVIIFVMCDC